jgi:peptidoglycan hydrolase-like amidase
MKKKQKKIFFILIALIFLLTGKNSLASNGYQDDGTAFYALANSAGYAYEAIGFYAYSTQATGTVPIYRFYNPTSGDHFYTTSNTAHTGYNNEGIVFYLYSTQTNGTSPIYRFYNPTNGDHFYTFSNTPHYGYNNEGVVFYAFNTQSAQPGISPVYRFYNSSNGDHFYTLSQNMASVTIVYRFYDQASGDYFYTTSSAPHAGYKYEGIAFYAYSTQIADTVPIYRFYSPASGDHFYTTSNTVHANYNNEGIAFYAYPIQENNSSPVYRLYNSNTGHHFLTISLTEKNYLITSPLGPDISVGLWYNSKSDTFQIDGNKDYVIKDPNGNVLATVSGGTTTSVTYDSNCNFKISGATASSFDVNTSVTFAPADGDDSTMIFNTHRPSSSLDHYRGEIKVQYYHGPDVYGGNTGSTVSQVWIIDTLPLEQYVWGDGEMTGTGPIDHTRVMATLFRTYGYWYVKYATKYAPYGFQIRSDSGSQVYSGYDWETQYQNIKSAAQATQGIIVSYDGDVALTPYSSWSDGNTRSAQDVWGTDAYPWCQAVSDPYGNYNGKYYSNSYQSTSQLQAAGNHMVGLIAHGSLELASSDFNWSWDKILKYYYTGISLNAFY